LIDVSVFENENKIPQKTVLFQNYPNPFNPLTVIYFSLAFDGTVTLKIYDVLGREVTTLLNNAEMEIGKHEIEFDAKRLSSGIYFYTIDVKQNGFSTFRETKKLFLLK